MVRLKTDGGDGGLAAALTEQIEKRGAVSVAEYMQECLSHPQYGYYMTRDPFGVKGEFTTAPEISQLFGDLVGAFLLENWRASGAPHRAVFVELGPGRGTLAADILRITGKAAPDFCAKTQLHLVETSPYLRDVQRRSLAGFGAEKIFFHDDLSTLPDDRPLLVVANEFFDALPVRQFVMTENGWRERGIGTDGQGGFAFALLDGVPELDLPAEAETGAVFEKNTAAESVMRDLAGRIVRQHGIALVIDYGYAADPAFGDTFQALSADGFADPLEKPGACDLTAHVDFAVLRRTAEEAGAGVTEILTQGEFLRRIGIEDYAEKLRRNADVQAQKNLAAALHRLVSASEMGVLFKVMGISG